MKSIAEEMRKELVARGFGPNLESPSGRITMPDDYPTVADLVDMLVVLVARREKLFRPSPSIPYDLGKTDYEETVLAIECVKAVLGRLVIP
jgi:hypothetical protein